MSESNQPLQTVDQMPPSKRTEGTRRVIASRVESRACIDAVIASARHTLRIFDSDLSDPGYCTIARLRSLETFILASRGNRLLLVLHETRYLDRDVPRLMTLLRRHTHAFVVHSTRDAARAATDALVIADDLNYWHGLHQAQPAAVCVVDHSASTVSLLRRFSEIWESSEPSAVATVLGL